MQEKALTSFALYDLYRVQTWLVRNNCRQKLGHALI